MLPARGALRAGAALRRGVNAPALTKATMARSYATTAEEVPEIDPSLFERKVDMSNVEKGKGYYINYKKMDENIKIVRDRWVLHFEEELTY